MAGGQVVSQATATLASELLNLKAGGHQLAGTAAGSLSRIRGIAAQVETVSAQVGNSSGRAADTLSSATRHFCFTVSCALVDGQGQVWGVLAGDVNVSDLATIGR